MSLTVLSPPATEPVSLSDAKACLRVTHDLEDALIAALIAAARDRVEAELGVAMITTAFRDEAASAGAGIVLSRGPGVTITAASIDAGGGWEAIDPAHLVQRLDDPPYRVSLPDSLLFTSPRLRVDYSAGYGADPADTPPGLRQAILAMIAEAYTARDADPPVKPSLSSAAPWLAPFRRARL